jgi:hypothetical protein
MLLDTLIAQMRALPDGAADGELGAAARIAFLEWAFSLPMAADVGAEARAASARMAQAGEDGGALALLAGMMADAARFDAGHAGARGSRRGGWAGRRSVAH